MQPIGNDKFSKINQCLGWGDPNGGLWVIGLEEGRAYDPEDFDRYMANCRGFIEVTRENKKRKPGDRNQYHPMNYTGKIATMLTSGIYKGDWRKNWRQYRDNQLWENGSKICQANLYPLGKSTYGKWPPENIEMFGLAKDFRFVEYQQYVHDTRFRLLRESWETHHPQATICFGLTCKSDFQKVLGLTSGDERVCDDRCVSYPSVHVILTPHFARRPMCNKLAEQIAGVLKGWHVSLP